VTGIDEIASIALGSGVGEIVAGGVAAGALGIAANALQGGKEAPEKRAKNERQKTGSDGPVPHERLCDPKDGPDSVRGRFEMVCAEAQEKICKIIEDFDGEATFSRERYLKDAGGGGVSRVLRNGDLFEKAGVNLSVVYSQMPAEALRAATTKAGKEAGLKLEPGEKVPFFACGLSCVMHPRNPFCPTMHFNYRYFETEFGVWWFGGGTDITPSYLDLEDMRHFHGTYKNICDKHDPSWYPRFKKWADTYFYIPHRGETRGLGGIFFDDFNSQTQEEHISFSTDCVNAVTDAYLPILKKHRNDDYMQKQRDWQQIRRGRYAEFNLVYDRGTVFGLKMLAGGAGRIESILMSLPETARWEYCHVPEEGSPEAEIMDAFKNPREWV
jgi:coproporphyrinogen III oxidase